MSKDEFLKVLKEKLEKCYTVDCFLDDCEDERFTEIYFVETIGQDEHRWYVLEDNVYKVKFNDEWIYFGATEIGMLKSESSDYSDIGWKVEMFNVEKIIKESFKRI